MNCVKCGREIEHDQVFCPACLEEMEKYPVKPGTVVHIPKHPEDEEEKRPAPRKKPGPTPEQQIGKLKRRVWRLRLCVALLLMLSGFLMFAVSRAVEELDIRHLVGQNYSTEEMVPAQTAAPELTEPVS